MAENNHLQSSVRQSVAGESEGHESEGGSLSMAPPTFQLAASSLGATPPDGAGSGGEGPIQRQVVQCQLHEATTSADSVAILQALLRGENTAAMRAVARAITQTLERRTESGGEINLVCVGGGDQFNLLLTEEDARALLSQLNERTSAAADAAVASSFDTTRTAPPEGTFGFEFNREFASILPALRQADPVMEGGGTDPRNAFFTELELNEMFTPTQRDKLMFYFEPTHIVPEHLFDNGDLGSANIRQRIEISSHILSHGWIERDSTIGPEGAETSITFRQRVHARMCGHWVELVYNYAGAGITGARGMEFSFDHEGEATMGAGRLDGIFEGDRRDLTPEEHDPTRPHRSFRRGAFPMERFPTIEPGDWVYVFTNTDTAGGDHSGIFSHWVDTEPREENGVRYQRAVIFSQRRPEYGGTEDTWHLSDRDGSVSSGSLHVVTRVVSHTDEAEAPATTADVETNDLGVRGGGASSRISRDNEAIIRRHGRPGHPVDRQALIRFIQTSNSELMDRLEATGRATENELFLWRATNRSEDIEVLVRLNERMNNLVMGATTLERTMAAEHERVSPRRVAAREDAEANRLRLSGELAQIEEDLATFERAMGIITEAEPYRDELRRLRSRVSVITRQLQNRLTSERRESYREERRVKQARITELEGLIDAIEARRDAAVAEALATEGNWRLGRSSNHQHLMRLRARRDALRAQVVLTDEAGGYESAHPGRRDDFRGDATGRARLTGSLANLNPAPDWEALRTSGE